MEFAEALEADKSCNGRKHGLLVSQTTKKIKEWKLNERQQLLVDVSGLGNLIHAAGLVIDRSLLLPFCEMWSKQTNTARFHDFEMAPSLRDTAYILGIPVLGHVVTTGTVVNKSVRDLCFEYLGRIPDLKDCRSGLLKLSWLFSEAYLLCLIGSTLFPEREKDYVSPKYLPLLSDFENIQEYAWGAAALAHLYKSLSLLVMPSSTKKLSGRATLLMGWIYEHIPVVRPVMEDAPAPIFPGVRRWIGSTTAKPTKDVSDVNWEPYKDMDPASIPKICTAPDTICFSRTWLISFNIREIYVPDRYARQFGQEQHLLNGVPWFRRHTWSKMVDWSLKYASDIKHFQQLTNTTHCDHTTIPATHSAAEVLAPAATAQPSLGLSLMTMVEGIKKEFPIVERFFMQQSLPDEVARALSRIHELVKYSHPKEVDAARREGSSEPHEQAALDPPAKLAHKEAATEVLHDPETEAAPVTAPDAATQNGDLTSNPMVECACMRRNKKVAVREGRVESMVEEQDADERGSKERKRQRRLVEGGGKLLRRSNRH
uniref:Aminotransferase-like plant mobile domain-containing protein n=1 Tax=Setaria italica TaxID=4555 RepID=K4A1M0_SETIT